MFNILTKIVFLFKKPTVIIIASDSSEATGFLAAKILKNFLPVVKNTKAFPKIEQIFKGDVFLFDYNKIKNPKKLNFWIKHSKTALLIINYIFGLKNMPEEKERLEMLIEKMPSEKSVLIKNIDDRESLLLKSEGIKKLITFGFNKRAAFQITDLKKSENGTTFKLNFAGNTLPVWVKEGISEKEIYSILAGICIGYILNINLIRITQSIKNLY